MGREMLLNLLKATVSVALTPVTLVADILTLPASALDGDGPFDRTAAMLKTAQECVKETVAPESNKEEA